MEKKIKNIRIIINPASGRSESILPVINTSMKEAGIAWEASITHKKGDATRFADVAVKEGVDALAVYGGDGTLREAISGLMGSEIPLVILPGGSANVMATELGIPSDLKEACTLMGTGPLEAKTIDVGQFDKHYFISGISFGFEADMVKGADRETKNKIGIFAYFWSAAEALKKTKKAVYHLKIDGQEHEVQGLTCIITNTGNIGFSNISFDKHIDVSDGLLDVIIVRKANLSLFKLMIVTLIKRERPDNLELVKHWQGRDISVSSRPKQTVQCDGEILKETSLHIKIIPGAIKVLVPKKMLKSLNKSLLGSYALIAATLIGLIFFVHYYPTSFLDIHVTREIQELKIGNFTSLMEFISIFGDPAIIPFSIFFASLLFFLTHNRREFYFIFTTIIPDLLNILVKMIISRPRPTLENAKLFLNFNQSSFPSGHVVHYVVFFGFLLAVMFVNKKISWFWRFFIGIFSAFLIFTISISRIYLGAHWVTDVIGGYLFGFAYLGIILKFYLKGRGLPGNTPR